jgi:hypothetical protein
VIATPRQTRLASCVAVLMNVAFVMPTFAQPNLELAIPRAQSSNPAAAISQNFLNVTFTSAPLLPFPNPTDSNSPAFWDGDAFYIFNSIDGQPRRAEGSSLADAQDTNPDGSSSSYDDNIGSGRWLEAVIRDDDTGLLYGWYHNEIPTACPQGVLLWPQIGAVVSEDDGYTWEDLGLILTPRDGTVSCDTQHPVTDGGIGDFSVILDHNADNGDHYLYFIFSSYGGSLEEQGISFARMLWIDRDQPLDPVSGESRAVKWDGESWIAPGIGGMNIAIFHDAAQVSWTSINNNGYWGPSVHWNSDLNKFIVLMSRSIGGNYESGGIYMTYTTTLDSPLSWVQPKLIISVNQGWYPQVIGDPSIQGTDKLSGSQARYFNQGQSSSYIMFTDNSPANSPDRVRATSGR